MIFYAENTPVVPLSVILKIKGMASVISGLRKEKFFMHQTKASILENIIPQVLNRRECPVSPDSFPHRDYLDLVIAYSLYTGPWDPLTLIENESARQYGITEEELYQASLKGLCDDFAPVMRGIEYPEDDFAPPVCSGDFFRYPSPSREFRQFWKKYPFAMFRLTNGCCLYGSNVIISPDVLKKVYETTGSRNYYILPFTKNYVCIQPVENIDVDASGVKELFSGIKIRPEDFLSENIYLYNGRTGKPEIVP